MGLAALVVGVLILCVLAVTREPDPRLRGGDDVTASDSPTGPTSDGSGEPDDGSSEDAGSPSAEPTEDTPPRVADKRRVDFGTTADLPDGARIYDNESVGSGMVVEDGVLRHGAPRGPVAVSSLEVDLGDNVRKIGARVRFGGDEAGSVVLVAWRSSFVDARLDGQPVPSTGLRLVATAGTWELTMSPQDEVVASGEFTSVQGTAAFEVYRRGAEAWVVDPSGAVTRVDDPRIETLAGAWACWQLLEREASNTPAVIEAIWAG